MYNRDLMAYIDKEGENVDRRRLVQRIAKGIQILHNQTPPIAHGHLKPSNIIVNDNGDPLLSDFGLSKLLENTDGLPRTLVKGIDSYRWFAPEVVFDKKLISTGSDVYSFAMTVLQLMTNKQPFHDIDDVSVPLMLKDGQRPERPTGQSAIFRGLNDKLWDLLTDCWAQEPSARLGIEKVNQRLESMWN